jgi:hypothetical protein
VRTERQLLDATAAIYGRLVEVIVTVVVAVTHREHDLSTIEREIKTADVGAFEFAGEVRERAVGRRWREGEHAAAGVEALVVDDASSTAAHVLIACIPQVRALGEDDRIGARKNRRFFR